MLDNKKSFLIKNTFINSEFEDVIMGKKIIEKGYEKIYDSRCVIKHSHNYSLYEYFLRLVNEYSICSNLDLGPQKIKFFSKFLYIWSLDKKIYIKFFHTLELYFYYLIKIFAFVRSKVMTLLMFYICLAFYQL